MKACRFCNVRVENNVQRCPSCGSAVFMHVCDNCGTQFDSGYCPNCGVKAGQKKKICPDCGSAYFTNACPNCGYTPSRTPPVQKVEQTVIHKHVYTEAPQPAPTPAQARQVKKKGKGCGCGTIILVIIAICVLFGNRTGSRKKSTTSTRATNTPKVTATVKAGPTATPEPDIAAAQEKVDAYFKGDGREEADTVKKTDSVLRQVTAKKNDKVILVRRTWEQDRGTTGSSGTEPDYVSVLGYAAVYTDQHLEENAAFGTTPWEIPVYRKDKQFWEEDGTIAHKTEVVVIGQELELPSRKRSGARCSGHLHVIRMDTGASCWIDVANFVTKPYWENSLTSAREKGYCIAVFRQKSDYYPVIRGNKKAELADGTQVLLQVESNLTGSSPDKKNNPVGGLVFTEGKKGSSAVTVWFNEADLTLSY